MWNDIINFINSNSALWSFLVTISTIVYVILTFNLLVENIKIRKMQNQPNVIVDFEIKHIFLNMVVKNIGNDCASNIKIDVYPNIDNPFLNIDFLAPNREISTTIRYITNQTYDSQFTKYDFVISYQGPYKEKHNNKYSIDIKPLLDSNLQDYEKDLLDKLGKIKDELHNINNSILKKKG